MRKYELSEMRGADGSSLWHEVHAASVECAVRVSHYITSTFYYGELARKLASPRLVLYFQFSIKKEIYPFIRDACIIRWHMRNNKPLKSSESLVLAPSTGIFKDLVKFWPFQDVRLKLVDPTIFFWTFPTLLLKEVKIYIKKYLNEINYVSKIFKGNHHCERNDEGAVTLACHYHEGINVHRRNELSWYAGSGIKPEDVLIYFTRRDNATGKRIRKEVINNIQDAGFRWVALEKDIIEGQGADYWAPPRWYSGNLLLKKKKSDSLTDRWVISTGNKLLRMVHYWRSFYDDFNIKVNYITEEGLLHNTAQAIAFDIDDAKPGALVGKQRSEIYTHFKYYLGYYPRHVFFIWNRRAFPYMTPNYEHIENFVVTGYPYNIFVKHENFSAKLKAKGANFIIVLLDNSYNPNSLTSKGQMTEFYKGMLKWLLSGKMNGMIIKSKKPFIINRLHSIHPLLYKALETGRCIKLDDVNGLFPSDVCIGAEFAIGTGISSAVIECVIAGCKGIHYDVTNVLNHEFYKWGYEKLIFNDLQKMLKALEEFRKKPENQPGLGDWSCFMDQIDHFRDKKGGERTGVFMRWLLEGFASGASREKAIKLANERYINEWGKDSVVYGLLSPDKEEKDEGFIRSLRKSR